MSDGSRLRQSWYTALNDAEAQFRQLLTSPPTEWKRLTHSTDSSAAKQKGKARASSIPELGDVVVHRNSTKSGEDVYRMVLDVPTGEEHVSLEPWKAVLTTPELRQEWDPAVEEAHLIELFDRSTRISKTNYTLGWPANPRDSVTISRAFYDATTLIDISTSLPRSPDEPAYLRPSPPYVRSNVQLFSWCIQHIQPIPPTSPNDKKSGSPGRIRLTCFWQHDLKALWGFGTSTAALTQQLATMTLSLLKTVMKRGGRVPNLVGYGNGVSVERVRYQNDREALTVDYSIIPDDEEHSIHHELGLQGMDEVHALREHRRLTRSIECVLPSLAGWDVQVTMKGSSEEVERMPWSAHATRSSSNPLTSSTPDQVILRLTHGALTDDDAVLKVKVVIEVSGGTRGLRLNGLATKIHDLEERDPTSYTIPQKMLQDVASAVDLSIQTSSSLGTVSSGTSSSNGQPIRPHPERTPAAEKSILSKVRRNYIYFSSLLQEPEAKWKRTTEARGVSITQLDSIDPTLVVYRAEATFVGVGLWDLYGAVVSPGARIYWDKQHEDGRLLEDVNELTELWHFKTKPAWPVNGRDAVVLKTVYKSPSTIHVFSFSADDPHLFPHIPPVEPNVIRTQVDLQGWAIEALSPTTTLLTLLEQSDPKGWTNKTSIPTQMINTLAGIGEFAIKCGGPPFVTRLAGSKANEIRYDHERGMFKVEYEPSASRRSTSSAAAGPRNGSSGQDEGGFPAIECEIRCDIDTWGASLDIVVDPPPQNITCLRRHRLSAEGGGLWLTLTHDSIFVDDERLLALVRRAPGKEKGLVMVNGTRIQVDVEELPEHEIKSLTRQKRVKPPRIPLDQPPVMSVIRRRKAEWNGAETEAKGEESTASTSSWASAPKISSPLARFFTYYVDQAAATTQQAVAAISPANAAGGPSTLDPAKPPMQYALDALAWTQQFHSQPQSPDGWTLVSDKGMIVQKKLMPEISPFIPVHKGFKVIEGVSAEELAAVIAELDGRRAWDERHDAARVLESYGGHARTAFVVAKGWFPFRDRGFYLASVVAREHGALHASSSSSSSSSSAAAASLLPAGVRRTTSDDVADQSPSTAHNAIFCVSASYSPDSASAAAAAAAGFSPSKCNPSTLPLGRAYLDAWVLETLDPYTREKYAIPSARCTRLVAVDYAGAIPAAVNAMINAAMARGVLALEMYMRDAARAAVPVTRVPAPGVVLSDKRERGGERGPGGEREAAVGSAEGSSVPGLGWKLRRRDENRVLVEARYDAEKRVYKSTVLVVFPLPPQSGARRPRLGSSARRDASSATVVGVAARDADGDHDADNDADGEANAQGQHITPRPSRLALHDNSNSSSSSRLSASASPSRQQESPRRKRSERSLSRGINAHANAVAAAADYDDDDDAKAASASAGMSSSRSGQVMPGSMVVTPALASGGATAFPSSSSSSSSKRAVSPASASPMRHVQAHVRAHTTSASAGSAGSSRSQNVNQNVNEGEREGAETSNGRSRHNSSISTMPMPMPIRMRQRAASSGAGVSYSYYNVHAGAAGGAAVGFGSSGGGGGTTSSSYTQQQQQGAGVRGRTVSSGAGAGGVGVGKGKSRDQSMQGSKTTENDTAQNSSSNEKNSSKKKKRRLVLMEVVLDSRMVGRAGYRVGVAARRRGRAGVGGGGAVALGVGPLSLDANANGNANADGGADVDLADALAVQVPFTTSIYTLPPEPLHSSSLAEGAGRGRAVRFLVRVEVEVDVDLGGGGGFGVKGEERSKESKERMLDDPLIGARVRGRKEADADADADVRRDVKDTKDKEDKDDGEQEDQEEEEQKEEDEEQDDPRPAWLRALQSDGLIVDFVVEAAGAGAGKLQTKEKEKEKETVWVNGVPQRVLGEKESLDVLGRGRGWEEGGGGAGGEGVLVRTSNESMLPEELRVPVGIARDLLVPPPPPALALVPAQPSSLAPVVVASASGGSESPSGEGVEDGVQEAEGKGKGKGGDEPGTELGPGQTRSAEQSPVGEAVGSGGFLGFWNPLVVRFGVSAGMGRVPVLPGTDVKMPVVPEAVGEEKKETAKEEKEEEEKEGVVTKADAEANAGGSATAVATMVAQKSQQRSQQSSNRVYGLSTVVFVGLIAFLMGSLLRSLLSPADFIYVVTDLGAAEEAAAGWREIRRLLEIKYLVGGWDFQVAVVRRH